MDLEEEDTDLVMDLATDLDTEVVMDLVMDQEVAATLWAAEALEETATASPWAVAASAAPAMVAESV